jgi:hypothetical protein
VPEPLLRFIHHVVFENPLTIWATAIGALGGAVTGLWNPLQGGFTGALVGYTASRVFEDPDDEPTIPVRVALVVGTVLVIFGVSKLFG